MQNGFAESFNGRPRDECGLQGGGPLGSFSGGPPKLGGRGLDQPDDLQRKPLGYRLKSDLRGKESQLVMKISLSLVSVQTVGQRGGG